MLLKNILRKTEQDVIQTNISKTNLYSIKCETDNICDLNSDWNEIYTNM